MKNTDWKLQGIEKEQQISPENTGFSILNAKDIGFPVLIGIPHAGRLYPKKLLENLKIRPAELLRLEDRYADRLATSALASGFPAIIAHQPRAWIDLNRKNSEIDPDIVNGISASELPAPTRKVRGGLGLIPRRLNMIGELWVNRWDIADIQNRIATYHEPYHQAVTKLLGQIRDKFGVALLLDLHSMPPLDMPVDQRKNPPGLSDGSNIVIGDRYGRSAGDRFSELAVAYFQEHGFFAQLNHPYSGGYILERHGDPNCGVHAIQVEVDRACYLDQTLNEPSEKMTKISDNIEQLAQILTGQLASQFLLAAE